MNSRKLIGAEDAEKLETAEEWVEIDDITGVIVDAAVKIHRDLGSCLFESVYELALSTALQRRGLRAVRQQPIGFVYEGMEFEHAFRVRRRHDEGGDKAPRERLEQIEAGANRLTRRTRSLAEGAEASAPHGSFDAAQKTFGVAPGEERCAGADGSTVKAVLRALAVTSAASAPISLVLLRDGQATVAPHTFGREPTASPPSPA